MLAEALFAAMSVMPCPVDEPKDQCLPWRAEVAAAVARASEEATCTADWSGPECKPLYRGPADELASILLEIAYSESGLRKRIQADECRDDECDAVRHIKNKIHYKHLAKSMWQLHESPRIPGVVMPVPHDAWMGSTGTAQHNLMTAATSAIRLYVVDPKSFGHAPGIGKRAKGVRAILGRVRAFREAAGRPD